MHSVNVVEEIDRLLQEGRLSQRKIAARLGVSRGTVNAIANGQRGLYGKDPTREASDSIVPSTPPERCSRCGFRVYMPCLVCRTREFRRSRQIHDVLTELLGRTMVRRRRRARAAPKRSARRSRVA